MSSWRSKNSNKKSDCKQMSKIDHSSNLTLTKQNETSNSTIENDETSAVLKQRKQTSTSKQLRNLFCFRTSVTQKGEQQIRPHPMTSETAIGWEQILDREFRSLDIDADGYVSIADLQSVLRNFSHICNSNQIMLRIFEELDLNHDQRISKQEFKLYKNILLDREKRFNRSTFEEKLSRIFALFDQNQDNYISPNEIRQTMENLGENIDDNLVNEMMQTADIDHDGLISRDEFKKLLIQLYQTK